LLDPELGRPIDDALVVPFLAPASYTGEDLVEFHTHGNPMLVDRLIDLLVAAGARPAGPGAFTRRAVLAGRMDLPAAEALADLLDAVSPRGAALALGRMGGDLADWTASLADRLLAVRAALEATVDFPDEDIDPGQSAAHAARLQELAELLLAEVERSRRARLWTGGAAVVVAGAPNAGKSTLLNRLLGVERAIVGAQAGTTRDWLEAPTVLDGLPVRLIDTAGLRDTADDVEAEGVRRAAALMAEADLVIHLRAPDADEDAALQAALAAVPATRRLVVWNKRDLAAPPPDIELAVAAAAGEGIDHLVAAISRRLRYDGPDPRIGGRRQETACLRAADALAAAAAALTAGQPPEIAVEDLRYAQGALADLLGAVDVEAVLDRVFATFCIGK
jgi:tRNA modification GTPase